MAKLNSGTRIYGTANVDTQINIGIASNTLINTTFFTATSNNAIYLNGLTSNTFVNTGGSYTFTSTQTFNANVTFNTGLIANNSVGNTGQILFSNGSSIYWNNVSAVGTVTSVSSGNGLTGGPITSTGTLYVLANTGIVSNTSGLSVNSTFIGTLTANNATYVNSKPEANLNVNSAVYSTNSINANNSAYAYGKTENVLNVNSAIYANNTTYAFSKTEGVLNVNSAVYSTNANNASYLNGLTSNAFVNTGGSYTFTQPQTFNANVIINNGFIANGSIGSTGQVLFSNGSAAYWNTVSTGSVSSVGSGNGLSGGPITSSGTLYVLANTGIISNTTGLFANSTYINSLIVANPSSFANSTNGLNINGNATNITAYNINQNLSTTSNVTFNQLTLTGNLVISYLAANNVYGTAGQVLLSNSNGATYWSSSANNLSVNATNITTGTLPYTQLGPNVVNTSSSFTFTQSHTFNANVILNSGVLANNSLGVNNSVLTSNGSSVFWSNGLTASTLTADYINIGIGYISIGLGVPNTYISNSYIRVQNTIISYLAANNVYGTAGQILTSNSSGGLYWSTPSGGSVSSVASGNGLFGGPITTTGTLYVLANTGIVSNTTGLFVNSTFISTLSVNNATNLNGVPSSYYGSNSSTSTTFTAQQTFNANAIFNSGIIANNSVGSAGQVLYSNGSSVYWAASGGVNTQSSYTFTGIETFSSNAVFNGNTVINAGIIANSSIGTTGQILISNTTGGVYWTTSANSLSVNATNITTGTIPYTQLGVNVVNTTAAFTITGIHTLNANLVFNNGLVANGATGLTGQALYSNGSTIYWGAPGNVNTQSNYTFTGIETFNANVVINGNAVFNSGIIANGSIGTTGQLLASNLTGGLYWTTAGSFLTSYSNNTIGNATNTTFVVTHSLNSNNILTTVREINTGYIVYPDIQQTTLNTMTLSFVDPPTLNQYSLLIFKVS